MTRDSLHKALRQTIEATALRVCLRMVRTLIPRLTDIVEAIDRIHGVFARYTARKRSRRIGKSNG